MPTYSLLATKRLLEDTKLRSLLSDVQFSTDAPPKPRDTVTLTTITSVGEALRVCFRATPPTPHLLPQADACC